MFFDVKMNGEPQVRISVSDVGSKYHMFFLGEGERKIQYLIPKREIVNLFQGDKINFVYEVSGTRGKFFIGDQVSDSGRLETLSRELMKRSNKYVGGLVKKYNANSRALRPEESASLISRGMFDPSSIGGVSVVSLGGMQQDPDSDYFRDHLHHDPYIEADGTRSSEVVDPGELDFSHRRERK